jgi:hypothetical protein
LKSLYKWIGLLALTAALLAGGYYLLTEVLFGPSPEVKVALQSDDAVKVKVLDSKSRIEFAPVAGSAKAGLIMYPENYQDIRMYSPALHQLANRGYLVVILSRRGSYSLPVEKEMDRLAKVRADHPEITSWFIGAHSWEAGVVSGVVQSAPSPYRGIVFWAGRVYPESDMSSVALPVLNIYGTKDEENENLLAGNGPYLPADTQIVWIEGGNRVNYANYGPLARDVGATTPREEQQSQAVQATDEFIQSILK